VGVKAPLLPTRVLVAAALLAACSGRAPAPPGRDAATGRTDAGPVVGFDAGTTTPPGRPDGGARLPPVDREIVLEYFGDPVEQDLEVAGGVGTLDVFFSIDTTGSFGGEIDELQSTLRSFILPQLRDRVASVRLGVGRFEDFPAAPWGGPEDLPFRLLTPITDQDSRVASAVASLDQPLGNGGDIEEASAEALWQIATGEGYRDLVPAYRGDGLGGVGFREDALRAVVHVTDAPTHEPEDYGAVFEGTHSVGEATEALRANGVRVLGIASGAGARRHLETVAIGTGAVTEPIGGLCPTGIDGTDVAPRDDVCPLVFDVNSDGTGVGATIVDAIVGLLSTVQYEEVWAETDDGIGFVRTIEAVEADPPPGVDPPGVADRRPPGDGIDDTFTDVGPGTRLAFRAILRNETIPPADYDQFFNLVLRVVGDGVTLLSRTIRVIVPRGRLDAGAPDAGALDAGPVDSGVDAGPATDAGIDAGAPPDAGIDGG